jgi:hypothetical protein
MRSHAIVPSAACECAMILLYVLKGLPVHFSSLLVPKYLPKGGLHGADGESAGHG